MLLSLLDGFDLQIDPPPPRVLVVTEAHRSASAPDVLALPTHHGSASLLNENAPSTGPINCKPRSRHSASPRFRSASPKPQGWVHQDHQPCEARKGATTGFVDPPTMAE